MRAGADGGNTDIDCLAPEAERLAADLDELSGFAESAEPGHTRRLFSEAYRAEREWVRARMVGAGLETHIDAAGNVLGRLPGRHRDLPALMTGSHTDTVHGGGRYDGIVGVLGGIEVARRLREEGVRLDRDLIVVDFLGEEANPFGLSCLGSRSISGILLPEHLDRTDGVSNQTLGAAMSDFGLDPAAAVAGRWDPGALHAYVELHIEQGPVLERTGKGIGVVTAIAGIERLMVQFAGRADHAGTMPMSERRDALVAAAEAVLTIEREACGAPIHGVGTTGRIESLPGAFNIVPDEARIWAEMRSVDPEWLRGAKLRVAQQIAEQSSARGVDSAIEWLNDQEPVVASDSVQDVVGTTATSLGFDWDAVPSGAGHDAAHMAHLAPMGMIFIPSEGGRSHVPEEFTSTDDIARGVHALTGALVALDRADLVAG